MNQFFIFIAKETRHILRDVYTLVVLLVMPVVLLLILGFAITNEIKNTPFVVLDQSKSTLSRDYIHQLDANAYFSIARYLTAPKQVDEAFQRGECKMAIVFPASFEEDLIQTGRADIQLIIDASDPNEALTIENYVQLITLQFQNQFAEGKTIGLSMNGEVKMLYNPQIKSAYSFVPGLMGMLMMLICALMTSASIVREKERGTMEVLLISPLKPTSIVLAKTVPYFVISMIDVVLIMLIAVFLMGVPVMGSLAAILAISVVFTLAAVSLGMLISTIANDQVSAMMMSIVGLMVPSMLLSGVLFPIDSMPFLLQILSDVVPAKWYIAAIRSLMIKGVSIAAIWQELVILFVMAFGLLFISIRKFKNRL